MYDEEKIISYMSDRQSLLQEWHRKHVAFVTGIESGEPVSALGDIKKEFEDWVARYSEKLCRAICPRIEEIRNAGLAVSAIGIISRAIQFEEFIGPTLETACLLSIYGIEKLCQNYGP